MPGIAQSDLMDPIERMDRGAPPSDAMFARMLDPRAGLRGLNLRSTTTWSVDDVFWLGGELRERNLNTLQEHEVQNGCGWGGEAICVKNGIESSYFLGSCHGKSE